MSIKGYIDYQRREFCKNVRCPVQLDLDLKPPDSEAYEQIRQTCTTNCRYTTYQFHHWLINQGYVLVRPE
jgi:hypothetical protein